MKYCVQCGNQMNDSDVFCMHCGKKSIPMQAPSPEALPLHSQNQGIEETDPFEAEQDIPLYVNTVYEYAEYDPYIAEEKEFIDSYVKLLNTERVIWFVFGIIGLCVGALMLFSAFFSWIDISAGAEKTPENMMSLIYSLAYAIAYIPVGIVCIAISGSKRKVNNVIYDDIIPASEKAGSAGNIVLGGLFNTVAMIFAIINLVKTKSNKEMIARISARQQAGKQAGNTY